MIDLLHLSSHVFNLFYIFSFFSTFHPFMYLENKNYHVLHITSCFFRMSMKILQFQSLFTCLTYNPFMYLEKKYYHVLHITSRFFRMSMKKGAISMSFTCLTYNMVFLVFLIKSRCLRSLSYFEYVSSVQKRTCACLSFG